MSTAAPLIPLLFATLLSAQTSIFHAPDIEPFTYSGPSTSRLEIVPVEGQDFTRAMRLRTPDGLPATVAREYSIRVRALVPIELKRNDWILATFSVRATERSGDTAYVKLNFERATSPYTKSLGATLPVTDEWKRFQIPFQIAENYNPRESYFDFWLGYDPQVIEIGGVKIEKQEQGFNVQGIETGYSYQGRESGAPWRKDAAERIGKHRMADFHFTVTDANDTPLPATVQVRMKRHSFAFGTAVVAQALLSNAPDDLKYKEWFFRLFNSAVFENDFKWPGFEQNRTRALTALDYLRGQGITMLRGHTMVWPAFTYLPRDLPALANNPEAMRQRINTHILDVGRATAGKFRDWDVLNEPITNRDLQKVLGDEEMVEWFKKARESDPQARLFINEYNIIPNESANKVKQDEYFRLITWLKEKGAPLDGLGEQGHFGFTLTGIDKAKQILDRFAELGLIIQVTEFDIDIYDEKLQADYTRDYLTLCFSHPSIDSFLMWGFWEARHWKPQGAILRRDWTLKPNGEVWRDLITKEWWTNADLKTDDTGLATQRGFLGDYEITVLTEDGRTKTIPATLVKDGTTLTIKLD